jgi:transposase-like protein
MEDRMPTKRHFTAEQKADIVMSHLVDQVPVSDICVKHDIQPNMFYRWKAEFRANASAAFEKTDTRKQNAQRRQTENLKEQLQKKDSIIAYVTTELMKSKKKNGEI